MRQLAALLLVCLGSTAFAAACQADGDPIVLNIQDFGTAYFQDFTLDPGRNAAQFRNGVCLHAPDESWTVNAASIDITGLQPGMPIAVSASDATLSLDSWFMTARELSSDGRIFVIADGTFRSEGMTGTVERVVFDLETGEIDGTDVKADGPGYRLTGGRAIFSNDLLNVVDASVTTCKCPGDPVYLLVGDEASVSLLEDGQVTLLNGEFRMGWLRLGLAEEFTVTDETLSALSPPLMVDWDPAGAGEDPRGHGLALMVAPFNLHEDLTMEFGLTGVDSGHPLTGYLMLEAATDDADVLIGYERDGGPRADFNVRHQLHEHFRLTAGANNRHYADQAFLHEGYLTVATTFPAQTFASGGRFSWGGSATVAATSQVRAGVSIISPRLRTALHADLLLPESPAGTFRIRSDLELSNYSAGREQYGLRLRPSWSRNYGPLAVNVSHDWRFTDAGSPFTTAVDLLSPINRTSATARIQGLEVEENVTFDFALALAYNWLRFDSGDRRGFEDLSVRFGLEAGHGDWLLSPHVRVQLAGLLDPRASSDRYAFAEVGLSADSGDIEFGLLARQQLGGRQTGLEILELSAGYPLHFENVKLVPFVALDLAPIIAADAGPALSGHGLVVEWDSCCGLFEFGYRIHRDELTTVLRAEFIH